MSSTLSPQTLQPEQSTNISDTDDTNKWSPAQESALLQALIRYKPVGIHKHFRMIAIRDQLLSTGLVDPKDSHTSTQGIWRKLATLYDLERLDEREDSTISDGTAKGSDMGDGEGNTPEGSGEEYWREFELPREDFEALMWQKRFAPDGASALESSRPQSPATVTGTRRESTVAETDEARSSPVSVSGGRTSGRGRGRGGGGGRLSRLQNEVVSSKGSRRTSKAPSAVEVEDEPMGDVDDEEDVEEEQSESEEDEESEEQEADEEETGVKKGSVAKRGRGGSRGRGRRGRRR